MPKNLVLEFVYYFWLMAKIEVDFFLVHIEVEFLLIVEFANSLNVELQVVH